MAKDEILVIRQPYLGHPLIESLTMDSERQGTFHGAVWNIRVFGPTNYISFVIIGLGMKSDARSSDCLGSIS